MAKQSLQHQTPMRNLRQARPLASLWARRRLRPTDATQALCLAPTHGSNSKLNQIHHIRILSQATPSLPSLHPTIQYRFATTSPMPRNAKHGVCVIGLVASSRAGASFRCDPTHRAPSLHVLGLQTCEDAFANGAARRSVQLLADLLPQALHLPVQHPPRRKKKTLYSFPVGLKGNDTGAADLTHA